MGNKRLFASAATFLCFLCVFLINGCATTRSEKAGKDSFPASKELSVFEYILGSGDRIEITVYRHDDLNRTFQIGPSGRITYPLIGDIQATGLSIFALRDRLRDSLSKYIINPQVGINVTSMQSKKIFVLGEVKNPGIFTMDGPTNVIEAILNAGGFNQDAKQGNVLLIRGGLEKPELKCLNIKKLLTKGDQTKNAFLQKGDIVYVPATKIADVARFFDYLYRILEPIYDLERGIVLEPVIRDVFRNSDKVDTRNQPIVIGR